MNGITNNEARNNEINFKIKKIQDLIKKKKAEACIISSSVNQFWLFGFIFDGYIFITQENEPILFARRPYDLKYDNIINIRKPEQIPDVLRKLNIYLPQSILLETDYLSYTATVRLKEAIGANEIYSLSADLRNLRMYKSEYEQQLMRESANIHTQVYKLIPSLYRKGMTDLELQIEIEKEMRLHGSIGIFRAFGDNMDIFMGSILAGDNAQTASPYDYALGGEGISPLLPLGANGTQLKPGTSLMVDMAGNYKPYMDDMSRTFAIEHVPQPAYEAHKVSIDIHREIEKIVKPGINCADVYNLAIEIVKENNLHEYFMGTKQQAKFIGHGVGLEINEPPVLTPRSKETLEKGMTFALEPKFVLPGIGAVGIENTYIVHDYGLENITLFEEDIIVLA